MDRKRRMKPRRRTLSRHKLDSLAFNEWINRSQYEKLDQPTQVDQLARLTSSDDCWNVRPYHTRDPLPSLLHSRSKSHEQVKRENKIIRNREY